MIASTTCRNSAQELHCHLGIPMAVRASGKRARERREHAVTSPPRPFNPGGNWRPPRATQGVTSGLPQKRGLSTCPWLSSSTEWSAPQGVRGKLSEGCRTCSCSHASVLTAFLQDSSWQSWGVLGFHLHLAFSS